MTVRLVYSQRTEALVEALAEAIELRRAQRGPLEPFHVVVPSRNLERHLTLALAERQGIVANLRFHRLERFVGRWLQRERIDVARVLDRRSLEAFVLRALLDDAWLAQVEAASLARYVGEEPGIARDRRRTELALRLARLLEGYAYSRPEMLRAWDRGELVDASDATERWQAFAWRQVRDSASKERIVSLHEALGRIRGVTPVPGALPSELHVVGLSYVARIFQWVFGAMGERTELVLHVLNPCREFWEDVPAATELRADPEEALRERDDDPPLLTWWGRPGREHVHLLNELTSGDFEERFVEVEPTTVLETVQRDVLDRRVGPDARASADGTIEAFACPGVRREVEVVAESIWRLVRQSDANDPLRFHEIAVLVHAEDRDTYLPHVAAVFGEAQRIPHHVVDLSLQSESRVVEAAGLLVDVLLSRFARPEVLALLRHPALRVPGAPNELDRAAWVRLVDRLGVFHGRDGADLEGTYLAPETLGVEAVTWAQGASRLALGAFLESETDASPFVGPFGPMHPEPGEGDEATPALALLVRSLIADARFAETAELSLRDWARFFEALFVGYLEVGADREESELRRCLAACRAVAEREIGEPEDAPKVRVYVAAELLREGLAALGGARGEYLADGVVVSALAPMRAIPFRVVFLLGMGEGRFPTSERRDPLDLRGRKRRIGDVTPAERDKYVFLETLLCARERFVVSWVARDELTGEPIEPSPVVAQLVELLGRRYVDDGHALIRTFPLRRHDEPARGRALHEAARESVAFRAGETLRKATGRDVRLEEVREAGGPLAQVLAAGERMPSEAEIDEELVLSLSALREFLMSPLQGWARSVLGLDRESDDDARAAMEDEPFRPQGFERETALREAFEEGLRRRTKPEELHEREGVPRLQAHGRWPLGAVASRATEADRRVLGGWRRLFGQTVARAGMVPRRVRFGAGAEVGESDVVRDPITLAGARIVGRTSLLFEDERASLVLLAKEPPQGVELRRERLRHALAGFVDYVALVAGGAGMRDSHRALVLYGGDAAVDASTRFGPLEPDEARRWLEARVRELRGEPHDVFLPFEAVAQVLTSSEGWRGMTTASLHRAIESARRRRRSRDDYGLVRREHERPAPKDARELVHRRFGLFARLVGLEAGGTA
ncbi:MAG: exodeoxyribonuclease V subunit gamma [Sandaracinus sp.]|nr:exodeoxyribonuclease V subunit gamma [Sandaracinus sp.]MCB9635061.1 exodeoxyribonuclease V subunit gamma [Sandaracinus sp.]